jgi:putative inorganic carbon (HCO3(-)) transporter
MSVIATRPGKSVIVRLRPVIAVLSTLALAVIIGKESTGSLSSLGVLALCLMVVPSLALALVNSKALPIYILAVWAFAPEVRRFVDWASGTYHAVSPISLAPILCTLMLLIPIMRTPPLLSNNMRRAVRWFSLAFVYALLVGLVRNHLAAVWEMLNYMVPMLVLLYTIGLNPDSKIRDRWLSSFSTIAVLVAVYGWIQYLTAPSWDVFWMNNCGMDSIGQPMPLRIRVFSTLNSPGPAANFLAFALVPMLFQRKWRGPFGLIGTLVVASALAITLVRSAWLMTLIGLIVYILQGQNINRLRSLIWVAVTAVGIFIVLPHLPGAESVFARGQSFSSLGQDQSANARIQFTLSFFPQILHNPLGTGFGSTGVATKLSNGGDLGQNGNFDNGVLDLFYTFGIVFTLVFFRAEWLIWKDIMQSRSSGVVTAAHRAVAVAMLIAMNLELLSYNYFAGIGGMLVWFVVSLSLTDMPRRVKTLQRKGEVWS